MIIGVVLFSGLVNAEINKEYLSPEQMERIEQLYPDKENGSYMSHIWFRINGKVISIPKSYYRKGKKKFVEELKKRYVDIAVGEAKEEQAKSFLMSKGITEEEIDSLVKLLKD